MGGGGCPPRGSRVSLRTREWGVLRAFFCLAALLAASLQELGETLAQRCAKWAGAVFAQGRAPVGLPEAESYSNLTSMKPLHYNSSRDEQRQCASASTEKSRGRPSPTWTTPRPPRRVGCPEPSPSTPETEPQKRSASSCPRLLDSHTPYVAARTASYVAAATAPCRCCEPRTLLSTPSLAPWA